MGARGHFQSSVIAREAPSSGGCLRDDSGSSCRLVAVSVPTNQAHVPKSTPESLGSRGALGVFGQAGFLHFHRDFATFSTAELLALEGWSCK